MRPVENARDRSDASGQIAASAIQQLTGFGYSELDAMCAIASQNGDTNAAHVLLYNHLTGRVYKTVSNVSYLPGDVDLGGLTSIFACFE